MACPTEEELLSMVTAQYGIDTTGYRVQGMMVEITTVFDEQELADEAERLEDELHLDVSDAVLSSFEQNSRCLEMPPGYMGIELCKTDGAHNTDRPCLVGYFLLLKQGD